MHHEMQVFRETIISLGGNGLTDVRYHSDKRPTHPNLQRREVGAPYTLCCTLDTNIPIFYNGVVYFEY